MEHELDEDGGTAVPKWEIGLSRSLRIIRIALSILAPCGLVYYFAHIVARTRVFWIESAFLYLVATLFLIGALWVWSLWTGSLVWRRFGSQTERTVRIGVALAIGAVIIAGVATYVGRIDPTHFWSAVFPHAIG